MDKVSSFWVGAARAASLLRFGAAVALMLVGLMAPTTALAQDEQPPAVVSPLRVEPDLNGINLVNGKYEAPLPTLSVPAAPRLRFDRIQNAAPYVLGKINRNLDTGDARTANFSVHVGASSSESFKCVEIECASVTGTGSTLTQSGMYYRQAGTGAYYSFTNVHVYTQTPDLITKQMYISSIAYPDGEVIRYIYETESLPGDPYGRIFYRPTRISTNLGYYITIAYQPGELGTMGWNTPSEAAIYSNADTTTPLGRLTYGANGTITDIAGRVYQVTGANNELGSNVETTGSGQTLPTEASPSLTITKNPTYNIVGSAVRDGVQWSYAYTNPVFVAGFGYRYDKIDITGPNGYHITYDVEEGPNKSNQITKRTDELNRSTNYEYDANHRLTKIIYPEANSVAIEYDGWGNIVRKTSTAKTAGYADLVEQGAVDLANCQEVSCYRLIWTRDALNRQTDYVYNAQGQLTQQLDPADASGVRRKTIIEYEAYDTGSGIISRKKVVRVCGETTTCGTSAEIRTEYEYWGTTYLPTVVRQVDQATGQIRQIQTTYDAAGRILSVDGPRAGTDDTQYFRYDIHGRKTWEIGALAPTGLRIARRFTFRDADDKVTSVETGTLPSHTSTTLTVLDRTDMTYDGRRNAIREAVTAGVQTLRVTDKSYLDRGLPDCTAVRMNMTALPAASSTAACSPGTQGAHGPDRISKNSYDVAGQLLKTQQALGTTLVQDYVAYTYTQNGKREYITDANGNKARFQYDAYDRQSHWYFPSTTAAGTVSTTDYEQYGYDAVGNRTSLRRRDGRTLIFAHDQRNRITSKLVPDGCAPIQVGACAPASATRDVYYSYDLMDRQLTARFDAQAGADGLTYAYDAFGNLVSSAISMAGFGKTLIAQYDEAGNRTQLTHPDAQAFTYAYDALGRLSGVYEGVGTTVPLDQFGYNARSLLESRAERLGSGVTYGYDTIGRLAGQADSFVGGTGNVTVDSISYNPASQMVGRSRDNDAYAWRDALQVNRNYAVNGLNQYTGAGPASFIYDANGNLITDGTNTYVYDAENRLISASNGTTLTYDPTGRLWQVVKGSASTRFLYDGDALIGEYDGAGALTARYVHGSNAGADDPLVWYSAGATRWLHADHQGSIVAVTNGSGGAPAINTYDEYGVPAGLIQYGIPGSANTGRFQYTGQAWIAELGLYHYKARIYSPTLGRFLQTDPIGYEDQINLYAYVGNDPVSRTDPTGMFESNTCSRVGGSSCSGSYAGDGLIPALTPETGKSRSNAGIGHNGPPPGALCVSNPPACAALALPLLLSGDTPQAPEGVGPVPDDQRPKATANAINNHLTMRDLDAARRELQGQIVAVRPNGTPYDHVAEVKQAQAVLMSRIQYIRQVLSRTNLTPGQRHFYHREYSSASSGLDFSRRFVP